MPYVLPGIRTELDAGRRIPQGPGELNYVFTRLITTYMQERKLSYVTINDVVGALEGAKLEFYRRIAVPYENAKMAENGDVYS